jgi:hypothetical protein
MPLKIRWDVATAQSRHLPVPSQISVEGRIGLGARHGYDRPGCAKGPSRMCRGESLRPLNRAALPVSGSEPVPLEPVPLDGSSELGHPKAPPYGFEQFYPSAAAGAVAFDA